MFGPLTIDWFSGRPEESVRFLTEELTSIKLELRGLKVRAGDLEKELAGAKAYFVVKEAEFRGVAEFLRVVEGELELYSCVRGSGQSIPDCLLLLRHRGWGQQWQDATRGVHRAGEGTE